MGDIVKTRGAVIVREPVGRRAEFEVLDLELEEPRQGEIQVKLVAAGLCHSDDHMLTGDLIAGIYPICGGHEGAGIVERVGPNTSGFAAGDHVIFAFLPICGRCRFCASGMQNLCRYGANTRTGSRPDDPGSYRMRLPDGRVVGQMSGISTFAERTTVNVMSAIKIDKDLPLQTMCLLGCGVGTGWGSAVKCAQIEPGHTVIVMGVGGLGINAVQGAAHCGASHILAVDPVLMKREMALKLGATHAFASIAEAADFARTTTDGQGADSAIVTVGVVTGEHVAQAFSAVRKAGTVVVTAVGNHAEVGIPVSLAELTLYQKRLQGTLFGSMNATVDIPRQTQMYRTGQLKLDELATTTYRLEEINQGFADLHAGRNIRGVVVFD
jgi:NDMA-dependent alcohol dehydrogenase